MEEKKLLKQLLSNFKKKEDRDLVMKAYKLADKYHGNATRKAGGKYIVHPLQVAIIIAERFKFPDLVLVPVALLHDLIEDTELTKQDIEDEFGEKIANIVDGLTKLDKITFSKKSFLNQANSKKLIRSVANDLQVMVVKLADRMNNLATLHVFGQEKRRRIARESLEFFALFAKRLGVFAAYTEITDASLLHIYGERIKKLKKKIEVRLEEEEPLLKSLSFSIRELLNEHALYAEIKVLEKGSHSFYDFERERLIENIGQERSLYRIAIIVEKRTDAYMAMGIVHSKFTPLRNSIVDMISSPKRNGFQSLFSHIKFQGKIFQFQFRTKVMDEIGELGVLYYWKKYDYFSTPEYFSEFKEILLRLSEEESHDIADTTRELIRESEIMVYVDDKAYNLHEGYKIIDLAYEVNPEIGENCIGGKNNNKRYSVYEPLIDGEQYKLLFDTSKIAIKNDWLIHAKSPKARPLIQKWLSARRKTKGVAVGEWIIQHYLKLLQIDKEKFINSETLKGYLDLNDIELNELYFRIATGNTRISELFYYFDEPEIYRSISKSRFNKKLLKSINKYEKFEYIVNDVEDYFIKFSGCCFVLPELKNAKGLLTPRGVAIHINTCKHYLQNAERYSNEIDIKWSLNKNSYETEIYLNIEDKIGALNLLFSKATKYKLNVDSIETKKKTSEMKVTITFTTENFKSLVNFTSDLEKYPDYLQLIGRSIKVL